MKKIQILRRIVQVLFTGLIAASLFADPRAFMLIVLILTVLCGPFYCGWICPYGLMQDIFGKAGNILGIKKRKMPAQIQKIVMLCRYAVLAMVLISGSDIVFQMMSLDPRVNFTNLLGKNGIPIAAGAFAGYHFLSDSSKIDSQPSPSVLTSEQNGSSEPAPESGGIEDGTYYGEGEGFKGKIVVEVTVASQKITGVKVVSTLDDKKWFERANSKIPESIVSSQSTDVDVVSGSTYSSLGIIDAVNDALEKAKQ